MKSELCQKSSKTNVSKVSSDGQNLIAEVTNKYYLNIL